VKQKQLVRGSAALLGLTYKRAELMKNLQTKNRFRRVKEQSERYKDIRSLECVLSMCTVTLENVGVRGFHEDGMGA
jgi:hypothetical protein